MNNNLIFIANWKMGFSFTQAIEFAQQHSDALVAFAQNKNIVLCPSFVTLHALTTMFKNTSINIGAQDCADHVKGAFTGQVSAESLKQIGCTFCIIGHSERRQHNRETDEMIKNKLLRLLEQNITPIICIGETAEDFKNNQTVAILEKQLAGIFNVTRNILQDQQILIAYEPVWSIGTGLVATNDHLEEIFAWLQQQLQKEAPSLLWKLLYGGSVKADNVKNLIKISHLQGFLIGGASLDFQEFKKIVECVK